MRERRRKRITCLKQRRNDGIEQSKRARRNIMRGETLARTKNEIVKKGTLGRKGRSLRKK